MIKITTNLLKADTVDSNGMVIPTSVIEEAVNDFNKNKDEKIIIAGELTHPACVNRIEKIDFDGTNMWGTIELAPSEEEKKRLLAASIKAFYDSLPLPQIKPEDIQKPK